MDKNTKIINFFGGPGIGKSTSAMDFSVRLKKLGLDVEYVPEVAKDFVWEGRTKTLEIQPYVTTKQYRNLRRLVGQVDFIVTDAPILMGVYYAEKYDVLPKSFSEFVIDSHNQFNNTNILLKRQYQYNPVGRNQTELEAIEIDSELEKLLIENKIKYFKSFNGDAFDSVMEYFDLAGVKLNDNVH